MPLIVVSRIRSILQGINLPLLTTLLTPLTFDTRMNLQQLKRYEARLRLLDYGLLAQSHIVANMSPEMREVAAGPDGEREDGEESGAVPVETVEDFAARLDAQVEKFIEESMFDEGVADVGSSSSDVKPARHAISRDSYKDGVVFAERKALLNEFGKKAYNKCTNCQA